MNRSTPRALARFVLTAAAAAAAASIWAGNRPEQGLLLDAQTWQEEVMTARTGPWPAEGWYRIVTSEDGLATYLLLSSKAQPGINLPTAEMPADL